MSTGIGECNLYLEDATLTDNMLQPQRHFHKKQELDSTKDPYPAVDASTGVEAEVGAGSNILEHNPSQTIPRCVKGEKEHG